MYEFQSMSSFRLSISKAADLSELQAGQRKVAPLGVCASLPVLKAIREVEIQAVVEAPIPKKLLHGQERMLCHHLFAIVGSKLRARLILEAIFVFCAVEAVCSSSE